VSLDIGRIDFAKGEGLVPAVVQDADTGAVLMLGYMNREAVEQTLARRRAVFYSRSKQRLWEKGETTGHTLDLVDVALEPRSAATSISFLARLEGVIARRASEKPEDSYTARLLAKGINKVAQKVGEEGVETALAGVNESDQKLVEESADLLFHLLVLLRARGLALEQVIRQLESRHPK